MKVSASKMNSLLTIQLEPPKVSEILSVTVWGEICEAVEVSDSASKWFSDYLNTPGVILVQFSESLTRKTDPKYSVHQENGQTAFSDGFPFLITSDASIDELNSKLDEPVSMEHFRPNIVLEGCGTYLLTEYDIYACVCLCVCVCACVCNISI